MKIYAIKLELDKVETGEVYLEYYVISIYHGGLKENFYATILRPISQYWGIKKVHKNKLSVAEMRMLRSMWGNTRKNRIRNKVIYKKMGGSTN